MKKKNKNQMKKLHLRSLIKVDNLVLKERIMLVMLNRRQLKLRNLKKSYEQPKQTASTHSKDKDGETWSPQPKAESKRKKKS